MVRALREQGINTSALDRVSAVIDMDAKGAATALRVSPHYYNTEAELEALEEIWFAFSELVFWSDALIARPGEVLLLPG